MTPRRKPQQRVPARPTPATQRPYVPHVVPTRSRINPHVPHGAPNYRATDVAYVVETVTKVPISHGQNMFVVTSPRWLTGWELDRKVKIATQTSSLELTIRAIADFGTNQGIGPVPNVPLVHWKCVDDQEGRRNKR